MTAWEPLRVLVAEDNADIAEVVTRLLDTAGLVVLRPVATRLAGLFDRLERERVDVLVMDLTLEDCDERAAVAAIAELAEVCAVVVVSATSNPHVAFEARRRGASTFISKTGPLAGTLERAVREAWHARDVHREDKMTTTTAITPAKDDTSPGFGSVEGKGGERLWKAVVPEWLLRKIGGPIVLTIVAAIAGWFTHAATVPAAPTPSAVQMTPALVAGLTPSTVTQEIDKRVTALEGVAQTFRSNLSTELLWRTSDESWHANVDKELHDLRGDVKALLQAAHTQPPGPK